MIIIEIIIITITIIVLLCPTYANTYIFIQNRVFLLILRLRVIFQKSSLEIGV